MDLFRRARVEKPETREGAAARLRDTIEQMQRREADMEAKAAAEAQNARQNVQRDKRAALAALKRRRSYQAQQFQTEGRRVAFEAQLCAIESPNGQTLTVALTPAPASSTSARRCCSTADSVEGVMDQIGDEIESIDQYLIPPALTPWEDPIDDDELEDELDALAAEAEDIASTPPAATRPAAPHPVRRPAPRQWQSLPTQDELDELAALEEAMAM